MVDRGCFGCSKHVEVLKLRKEVAFLSDESALNKRSLSLVLKLIDFLLLMRNCIRKMSSLEKKTYNLKKITAS